jgi:AraC-like DNA-binding protein
MHDIDPAMVRLLQSDAIRFVRGYRQPSVGHCPLHTHDEFEVVYHLSGRGEEWGRDGIRTPCTPETVSMHPAGCAHAQRMRSDGEDLCIHLTGPSRMSALGQASQFAVPAPDPLLRQAMITLCLPPEGGPLHMAMRNNLARTVLAQALLAQRHPPAGDVVAQAQRYLRQHYRTVTSVAEVAAAVGIGPDCLRHRFRRETGSGMLSFLTAVRIERARDLLEHSALPVGAIAALCGYSSHRHLGSMFRRAHGRSPRKHRTVLKSSARG